MDREEATAILTAARAKQYEAVAFLIEQGVDIDAQDQTCFNPFIHGCIHNDLRLVQMMCEAGTDLKRLTRFGGNGPQVGHLALQNAAYTETPPFSLDVLGAQTQGMIGYLIELELRNALADRKMLPTVLTLVRVDPADPAFANPTKFVGPTYSQAEADDQRERYGWEFRLDGDSPRRVVPSPRPQRIVQIDSCKRLLDGGHIVVSSGGGGVPVTVDEDGMFEGAEVVVDKDASSALLAESIDADFYVMATDADAVMVDWGTPQQRAIRRVTPEVLESMEFAAGSMGPKVEAACRFVRSGQGDAAIGRLSHLTEILAGESGTIITTEVPGGIEYA